MSLLDNVNDLLGRGGVQQALEMINARLALRDGQAALILAHWRMIGDVIPRDLLRARELFALASEWGEHAADGPLVALLGNGAGGQVRRWKEARERFETMGATDRRIAHQAALLNAMMIDRHGDPTGAFEHKVVSQDPLVVTFHHFMTAHECNAVIEAVSERLAPAMVFDPTSHALIRDPVRDSSAAAFPFLDENPFIHALNRRIAAASRSTPEQGEPTQVLVYRPGQQYRLHSDAIPGERNQRIQTFLVYLTEDFEGGATHFPHGDLSLRPMRGDAICFSNVTADMRPAVNARHAGLPVTKGTKYILSKWIRRVPLDVSSRGASDKNA